MFVIMHGEIWEYVCIAIYADTRGVGGGQYHTPTPLTGSTQAESLINYKQL